MYKLVIKAAISIIFLALIFNNCSDSANKDKEQLGATASNNTLQQTVLPQDVIDSCSVTAADFAGWFADGKVTENGFVNPANSLTFSDANNCNFYKWSEQMFLWLTSNGKKYEGGHTVLESPVFYVVSSPDSNGKRELTPYHKDSLLDASANINRMNTEEGQATDNVLLDKNGNLVYYITFVNDVFKALLNMAVQNPAKVNKFPTTQAELEAIKTFAQQNNLPLFEPNALAIELKTSWIKLEKDMNKADYITIESDIPVYDKKNDSTWVLTGQTTQATLALVGMHIVGSAAGHPEMIWSTFEHKGTAPNARYQYINKAGKIVDVLPDNSGSWLLNNNPQDTTIANANISHAKFESHTIKGKNGNPIKPSNTIRVLPWGSVYNMNPNKNDNTPFSNSLVIGVNNAVINKLVGNDVRKNYIFIGSTWTTGGVPNGKPYDPNNPSKRDNVAIGTSAVANSTMETDFQVESLTVTSIKEINTCFTCHNGTLDPKVFVPMGAGLSHVFKPLMNGLTPQAQMKKKK
jgi:hypothetical protein